jgi:uncharacterized protein
MKRIGLKIFAVAAAVCAALLVIIAIGFFTQPNDGRGPSFLPQETASINGQSLTLEIAATGEDQQKGLGGRDSLGSDAGMIFPFDGPSRPGFWMKGMRFALDFIYVRDNKVVELKENVQPALAPVPFFPAEDIDAVIEVNAGWVKSHGIKVGDAVVLPI